MHHIGAISGMLLTPIRAFDVQGADIDEITAALVSCADLDAVVQAREVDEDTAEEAPFDVEPDQVIYVEEEARGGTQMDNPT
jgi:hypothetical protein